MTGRAIFIAALALGACGQGSTGTGEAMTSRAATQTAAGCEAEASIDWSPVRNGPAYRIVASASNPTCTEGTARITITDASGKSLFTQAYDIAPMTSTIFADATTSATFKAALQEWIAPGQGAETTRQLPDWPAGAELPQSGEFPFYPAEGMTRDAWLRLRAQDKPVLCFVQGGESMNCLVLDTGAGALVSAGAQSFPG